MENWALVKIRISRKRNAEGMSLCHLPNLHLLLAQWILRTSEIVFSKADLTSLLATVSRSLLCPNNAIAIHQL